MTTVSFGAAKATPPNDRKIESKKTNRFVLLMFSPSLNVYFYFRITSLFEISVQKSLPSSLFQREESFSARFHEKILCFPPLKRGIKGDFMAFQNAKMLSLSNLSFLNHRCKDNSRVAHEKRSRG
jgi:hypothetical protein